MSLNLSDEQRNFIAQKVKCGDYENAQEVISAALKALEYSGKDDDSKLIALQAALQAGEESGIAEGDVFEEARERIRSRIAGR